VASRGANAYERRAGLQRHLLEWKGREGGIPMGEDQVAAQPRQIFEGPCS
jgi:hypothetical protein